ncbi:hypothetical protein JNB11_08080 [Kocuria palustris]|nr:hypothetical protein [Kocuria palustris]
MINRKDDFDLDAPNFLDMVLSDMDFDQAYSMYTTLQQKQAVLLMETLQKVQLLNQQYVSAVPPSAQVPSLDFSFTFDHQAPEYSLALENYSFKAPNEPVASQPMPHEQQFDTQYDQFFSNTELDALEKFLDNLANPTSSVNPMDFYHHRPLAPTNGLEFNTMFDLHTMKPTTVLIQPLTPPRVKDELLAPFEYPHTLPTPHDLRQSLLTGGDLPKRRLEPSSDDEDGLRKRRRTQLKPLLTLEQKRLNHSHLEQKRRKLCKLAYERCLRLIIDIEKFNALPNPKPEERPLKLKRARVNKDGLPNLLKHLALIRISNEIITIQQKNEQLRLLLAQYQ